MRVSLLVVIVLILSILSVVALLVILSLGKAAATGDRILSEHPDDPGAKG
jgi:hypothetical protein